jgi:hypothetical protein
VVHVDLDLQGVVPAWLNSSADIDFDLTFRFTRRNVEFELDVMTSSLVVIDLRANSMVSHSPAPRTLVRLRSEQPRRTAEHRDAKGDLTLEVAYRTSPPAAGA